MQDYITHVEDQRQILMFDRDVINEERNMGNFLSGLDSSDKPVRSTLHFSKPQKILNEMPHVAHLCPVDRGK